MDRRTTTWVGRWVAALAAVSIGATACSTAPKLPDRVERPTQSIVAGALAQDALDPLELDPNWLPLGHAIVSDTPPSTTPTTAGDSGDGTGSDAGASTTTTNESVGSLASVLARVRAAGVPSTGNLQVVLAACYGGTSRGHWGYFNNGAAGGPVTEPGGIVVPVSAICINPSQPDMYSGLVHEMGHQWFWETGAWETTKVEYGGREQAAECFAKIWGAIDFGSGGCPDEFATKMRAEFSW